MTRIIDNYSFVSKEVPGMMVDPRSRKSERYCVKGKFIDSWNIFIGGEPCLTSTVKELTSEGEIATENKRYKLRKICPDYNEFLNARNKGIMTVGNWNIYGGKEYGYYLTADIFPERKALGRAKIISKEGNFLTIRRIGEAQSKLETVFVCWSSMSMQVENEIMRRGELSDIPYADFQEFNGCKCKPILEI